MSLLARRCMLKANRRRISLFSRKMICASCFLLSVLFVLFLYAYADRETVSQVDLDHFSIAKDSRYLLYDVNQGEGFNLRRDVYMRVANLVRQLRDKGENFVLVLPPWSALYHWQSKSLSGLQTKLPWGTFFDLESLNRFVPVIEFETFVKDTGKPKIDIVYYLQHYAEGWKDGKWEEKWDFRPCIDARYYYKSESDELWRGWFWGYEDFVTATALHCISVQGHSATLLPLILAENNTARSIMIDRAETVLHDSFGDVHYWNARKSMRYNKELRRIGDEYRRRELDSNDEGDGTVCPKDWRSYKPTHGDAKGGPFLCVHWRRKDFVEAHKKELPSIEGTAKQIERLLKKLQVAAVFLATDAPDYEVKELSSYLEPVRINGMPVRVKRYIPPEDVLQKYKDGGVSIIDQWICAHARYFIGSHVSTFSFRIQDDREILGFDPNTTFNRLCPDDHMDECEQPAKWKVVHS